MNALFLDDADPFYFSIDQYLHLDKMKEEDVEKLMQVHGVDRPHLRLATGMPRDTRHAFSMKRAWRKRYGAISQTLMEPDGVRSQKHPKGAMMVGVYVSETFGVTCNSLTLRSGYEGPIGPLAGRITRAGGTRDNPLKADMLTHVFSVPPDQARCVGDTDLMIWNEAFKAWLAAMDVNYLKWSGNVLYSALT